MCNFFIDTAIRAYLGPDINDFDKSQVVLTIYTDGCFSYGIGDITNKYRKVNLRIKMPKSQKDARRLRQFLFAKINHHNNKCTCLNNRINILH